MTACLGASAGAVMHSPREMPRPTACLLGLVATIFLLGFLPPQVYATTSDETTQAAQPALNAPLSNPLSSTAPPVGTLQIGLYVTAIDEIDLLGNSFNAQFYLSTVWSTAGGDNPSDSLEVLNAIHHGDIGRFELISEQTYGDLQWRLYAVRNKIINP